MEVVHQLDKVIEKIEKWIDDQTRPRRDENGRK